MAISHKGYQIHRDPVPLLDGLGNEIGTNWEFFVTKDGEPIPIVVDHPDREVGQQLAIEAIDSFQQRLEAAG